MKITFKKKYSLAAIVVLSLVIGSAAALVITALTAEKISIFGSSVTNSHFIVTSLSTKLSGQNKITETVTIQNVDTSAHATNVNTQLLDSSNNALTCTTPSGDCDIITGSGSILGGASTTISFSFIGTGIVTSYSHAQVVLVDTA